MGKWGRSGKNWEEKTITRIYCMKTVYFQYKCKHFDLFLTEEKAFLQKFNIHVANVPTSCKW